MSGRNEAHCTCRSVRGSPFAISACASNVRTSAHGKCRTRLRDGDAGHGLRPHGDHRETGLAIDDGTDPHLTRAGESHNPFVIGKREIERCREPCRRSGLDIVPSIVVAGRRERKLLAGRGFDRARRDLYSGGLGPSGLVLLRLAFLTAYRNDEEDSDEKGR